MSNLLTRLYDRLFTSPTPSNSEPCALNEAFYFEAVAEANQNAVEVFEVSHHHSMSCVLCKGVPYNHPVLGPRTRDYDVVENRKHEKHDYRLFDPGCKDIKHIFTDKSQQQRRLDQKHIASVIITELEPDDIRWERALGELKSTPKVDAKEVELSEASSTCLEVE